MMFSMVIKLVMHKMYNNLNEPKVQKTRCQFLTKFISYFSVHDSNLWVRQ